MKILVVGFSMGLVSGGLGSNLECSIILSSFNSSFITLYQMSMNLLLALLKLGLLLAVNTLDHLLETVFACSLGSKIYYTISSPKSDSSDSSLIVTVFSGTSGDLPPPPPIRLWTLFQNFAGLP